MSEDTHLLPTAARARARLCTRTTAHTCNLYQPLPNTKPQVGEDLEFTLEVDVYPQCPAEEAVYKDLHVDVERIEFNQEAYDNALLKLRHQHADLVPVGAGVGAVEGNQVLVGMRTLSSDHRTPSPG